MASATPIPLGGHQRLSTGGKALEDSDVRAEGPQVADAVSEAPTAIS